MDSLQLLTLYLAPTPIFSGRKAKINLHTTPHTDRLSAAVRGSRNFRHGGGGGGGPRQSDKKLNSDSVVCLFLLFS